MVRRRVVSAGGLCALVAALLCLTLSVPALAFQPRQTPSRFDHLVRFGPAAGLSSAGQPTADVPASAAPRQAWEAFVAEQGGGWQAWVDARSGLPLLAEGRGIAWVPGAGNSLSPSGPVTVDDLERAARNFVAVHPRLFAGVAAQMVLDREASGPLGPNAWRVTFGQVVSGVAVDGARLDFTVSHGNLVGFGATRWGAVRRSATPALAIDAARTALDRYLGVTPGDVSDLEVGRLLLVPADPRGDKAAAWNGALGDGYAHALLWRFVVRAPGEPAVWVADVDADSGEVLSFVDRTQYDRIKGGVFPVSNDGRGWDGTEQADFPLPFSSYTENGGPALTAGDHGLYQCGTLGSTINTQLVGPYVRVSDSCGQANESTTCDNPLDMSFGPGTDCAVPPGHSAGDTHAGRSSFYHLNRVMEKGRAWLPSNNWLKSQLTDNINIFSTCNAYWNGSVNFYRSGGGCRNTGEIAGVFVHEWGHGLDSNDGGGYDNPSEAYADVVAFFETHVSCVGRGFFADDHNCGGYGDACLDCSGIRDQDWNMHQSHTPATPSGFLQTYCGGGGGACGKEVHCEGYIAGETLWDLAVRDLPAMGLDTASAWQHAEQLFYLSRTGSGGNIYNCSLPNSDGCNANGWFHSMRVADDDDGNLNNGTPHAAAIFAAFNRHKIACGAAGDASNQNSSSCPTIGKPVMSAKAGSNSAQLTWTAVPNAASYNILRNDLGCDRAQIIIDRVAAPATTYTDTDLSNGFTVYYRVQAVGANGACVGPVSDCSSTAAQPFAGTVRFDQPTYACSATMTIQVVDGNVTGDTVNVTLRSTTEGTPETLTLTAIAPGSNKFIGTFPTTSAPAVHGDGFLSIRNGDGIDVEYIDADDGSGGVNVPRTDHATGDCVAPVITNVHDSGTTDTSTTIQWTTDEVSSTQVTWGPTIPPGTPAGGDPRTTSHAVPLSGLTSCTTYYYDVRSGDPAGNLAISNNGGTYYRFETLGNFGNGLQPCHQGRVTIDAPTWSCNDTVTFKVVDQDLNLNPNAPDTGRVLVTSGTDAAGEWITITETGANTSRFTGSVPTRSGPPAPDGAISTVNGDTITVTYFDANDGSGHAATAFADAVLDCAGPAISAVRVENLTNARGLVRFTTDEPSTTVVEYGNTPSLGFTTSNATLVTDHSGVMNQSDTCHEMYFRVSATDTYGNTSMLDNHGTPFRAHTWDIPGLYWMDNFEGDPAAWTLQGEWEVGVPQGKGGSSGKPDPASAYNDQRVLGEDLSGKGAYPGDYEPDRVEYARTAFMNASTWTHTKLMFKRRLQNGSGDQALLTIYGKGGQHTLWQTMNALSDNDWVSINYDVSSWMDGQPQVALEFLEHSDATAQYAGWTIDDVILKDGSKPDFAPCGGCGAPPSFAGASAAFDDDACAASGVTVSWDRAQGWGSAGDGTYAVYRGGAPGFPADAAHLVASGVTALAFDDPNPPEGQLYYLAQAENSESCGAGPKNGGLLDGNANYVPVQQTTTRPVPAAVTGATVTTIAKTHVRLAWTAAANATVYRVYRALDPRPGSFGLAGTTSTLRFDDLGAATTLEPYFYLIRGANPCGNEGP